MKTTRMSPWNGHRYGEPNRGITTLERLKNQLLDQELGRTADSYWQACVCRAAEEAASLAWANGFPLLLLPALFEEKVMEAWRQHQLQKSIHSRSQELWRRLGAVQTPGHGVFPSQHRLDWIPALNDLERQSVAWA